jgi:hypothetical protein
MKIVKCKCGAKPIVEWSVPDKDELDMWVVSCDNECDVDLFGASTTQDGAISQWNDLNGNDGSSHLVN